MRTPNVLNRCRSFSFILICAALTCCAKSSKEEIYISNDKRMIFITDKDRYYYGYDLNLSDKEYLSNFRSSPIKIEKGCSNLYPLIIPQIKNANSNCGGFNFKLISKNEFDVICDGALDCHLLPVGFVLLRLKYGNNGRLIEFILQPKSRGPYVFERR